MSSRTKDHTDPLLPELCLFDLPAYDTLWPWAREIAADLLRSATNATVWDAADRGILLLGDQKDWKKFVAKVLASSLGVRFYHAPVSEWLSASNNAEGLMDMRSFFHTLQDAKDSILFIDDLDGFTNFSNFACTDNSGYPQDLINEFVAHLSNLPDCVLLVGASSNAGMIQHAIRRGRWFRWSFQISLPDATAIAGILYSYTGATIELETLIKIAEELIGWSASDVEKLIITASNKARTESRDIQLSDLMNLIPHRSSRIQEDEFRFSDHQAGKAIISSGLGYISVATKIADPNVISQLKIHPTAAVGPGYITRLFPGEASPENDIAVLLSGAIAEFLIFGDCSASSPSCLGSDMKRAVNIALRLVEINRTARSELGSKIESTPCNRAVLEERRTEAFEILQMQYHRVLEMLEAKRDQLIIVAEDLNLLQEARIEHDGYFGLS